MWICELARHEMGGGRDVVRRRDESTGDSRRHQLGNSQNRLLPSAHLQETCACCTVCWLEVGRS